jgi:SAM-dependent methyltransferase/GT2 family glycosyltransferase
VNALEFTVVVPTVGRPRYLEGCLGALAALDYPRDRYEVVVVNDGGGAPTAEVIARFSDRLEVRSAAPTGTGPSAARNAGAAAARGRFVAFTDDDCVPGARWLAELERALAEHPGAAAGGRTVNGAPEDPGAVASQAVVDALHDQFNGNGSEPRFFASSNLAVPAADFAAVGGFDEGYRYAEDREFCERWLRSGRRFTFAPAATVDHMRTLNVGEFWRQHHGYGRGARAFAESRGPGGRGADTAGFFRALAGRVRAAGGRRLRLAAYLALSQVATAAGYFRGPPGRRVTGERVVTSEHGFNPTWQRHVAAYAACAGLLPPGGRVLDLGCGVGHSYELLGRETVGVDLDAAALAGQGRETHVADMRALPFADASFAAVVSVHSLEHVPDPERVVAEARRVLAPGGVAIFVTPNRLTFGRPDEIIDPYHFVELTADQLEAVAVASFDEVRVMGLFGSARYLEIVTRERRTLDRLLSFDFVRVRRLLSRHARQLLYDAILARVRRKPDAVAAAIDVTDFELRAEGMGTALDLVAACRVSER